MISRYDCPEIRDIWSEQNKYLLWTQVELTFLKHFRRVSVEIPSSFREEWITEIQNIEKTTKHDLAAFVQWLETYLESKIGAEARFVHYGLTSSDIVDTAFSLMIQETDETIVHLSKKVLIAIDDLEKKYGKLEMLGRTHGQAAEKILFKNKLSAYRSQILYFCPMGKEYFGRLAGSVGDYKYFKKQVEIDALRDLRLVSCSVNDGQVIHRALYARYLNNWATLASVLAKIALDIRLLAQTGIAELREGFAKGQMGSSSMPQKRNPILCENLCGLARVIRGYQATAMQNIELWNERDISHSSAERMVFPDAAVLLGFMITRLALILKDLYVDGEIMLKNIKQVERDISGQEHMLALISDGMSRKDAHELMKKELLSHNKVIEI